MSGNKLKRNSRRANRFEREIFEALEPNEYDVTRAADSPFLSRRLMVSIAAEKRRRAEEANQWSLGFGIVLRAIPGFAALALAFFCVFLFNARPNSTDAVASDRVVRTDDSASATGEVPIVSNEELVSIMLGWRPAELRGEQQ